MFAEMATLTSEDVSPQMLFPSPQPMAKVLREDSLKILDPSRKKLPSLETQRIAGVLDNCIDRVETVALLLALMAHLEELSGALGKELTGVLKEHHYLGEKLEGLGLRPAEGEEGEAEVRERAQLERFIQDSTRNVLRLLQTQPAATRALREVAERGKGSLRVVSEGMQDVVGGLKELRGVLLEKLLTSPAEERERSCYMQEVSLRHGNNMELVATLEMEVAAAIRARDAEISKKDDVIRKLKISLHQMAKSSEDFVLRTQQDADKQSQSDTKTNEGRQARMKQEANQMRSQLNNLIAENREVETTLRKKKYKVETEIENWIQKYDAEMEEKQLELEEMTAIFEEEKEELRELEEAYAVLEPEYTQIQEEQEQQEERKEEEKKELVLKNKAATLIQALWRGHRVRKAMRGKGKAKAKKGKKGKKGKGKKGK